MKKILLCLSILLLLLTACHADTPPIGEETPPLQQEQNQDLSISHLSIEFVVGDREQTDLFALRQALPPILLDSFADFGCHVDDLSITFGSSAAATAQALANGSVQIAWMPAESFSEYSTLFSPILAEIPATQKYTLRINSSIFSKNKQADPTSSPAEALGQFQWEDIASVAWLLPEKDAPSLAWLDEILAENFDGRRTDALENVSYGTAEADLSSYAIILDDNNMYNNTNFWVATEVPLYQEIIVLSRADDIISDPSFVQLFSSMIEQLSTQADNPLQNYGSGKYISLQDSEIKAMLAATAE